MATHSNILAWRITQRNLVAYSPWGRKDLGTTERLTHTRQNDICLNQFKCPFSLEDFYQDLYLREREQFR